MKKNIRYIALTSIFGLALCSSIVHCGDTNSNDVDYATEQAAIKSSLLNQIRGTGVLISDKAQQNFPTETSRQKLSNGNFKTGANHKAQDSPSHKIICYAIGRKNGI
jgi:hypothetical protein